VLTKIKFTTKEGKEMNTETWKKLTFWIVAAIIVFVVVCSVVGLAEASKLN